MEKVALGKKSVFFAVADDRGFPFLEFHARLDRFAEGASVVRVRFREQLFRVFILRVAVRREASGNNNCKNQFNCHAVHLFLLVERALDAGRDPFPVLEIVVSSERISFTICFKCSFCASFSFFDGPLPDRENTP